MMSDRGGWAHLYKLVFEERASLQHVWVLAVVMMLVSAGCAEGGSRNDREPGVGAAAPTTPPRGMPDPDVDATPSTTGTLERPPQEAPAVAVDPVEPFDGSIQVLDPAVTARMGASWRPGCPVPLEDLRLVTVTHWTFDGVTRRGEVVVHADQADGILRVFRRLFEAKFPLHQVRLVDEFDGDDDRSMAANNTSAFNCRNATGSQRWSEHAYGRALDVNPIQNPFVTASGKVIPPEGTPFVERRGTTPGLITSGDVVVDAFRDIGWRWGGAWTSNQDYQHFSATGR